MSDSDVAGDSPEEEVAGDDVPPPIIPQRSATYRQGALRAFVICASLLGWWHKAYAPGMPADMATGTQHVLGIALAYTMFSVPGDCIEPEVGFMRRLAAKQLAASHHCGFIEYPVVERVCFHEPIEVPEGCTLSFILRRILGISVTVGGDASATGHDTTPRAVLNRWRAAGARPLTLAPLAVTLAHKVMRGVCPIIHSVAVTNRLDRRRLLVQGEPSKKTLASWRRGLRIVQVLAQRIARPTRQQHHLSVDAGLVIDWVAATQHIKDIRKSWNAAQKWAQLFSSAGAVSKTALLQSLRPVCPQLLRDARIRLDCVAMLIFRAYFHSMMTNIDNLNIYIFL